MRFLFTKISLTALLVLAIFSVHAAEKVTFEANSPLTVAAGDAFRVEFALNAKPDDDTFKAPSFEGFDVLAGPAVSQGSSVQIVNGSMTKSVSYTYTFVLLPQAAGNVTIGAAEVRVDGTVYRTRPLPVEIVNEGEGARAQQQQGGSRRPDDTQGDVQSRIGKDDILLRAVVSRSSVYKNEPLHVAFKLYTRVPYVNLVPESAPSFNGFWSQDLTDPGASRVGRETYNGKVYETRVLYDYLLYPQQVGTLSIDPVEMTVVAQVVVQSRNADPFFGSGREVFNVPRKVHSQRTSVSVKALPSGAPASFSGAVGNFTMDAQFPSERIAANSGATVTVKISGTGNLTFVQAPKLPLPTSFEQYNVKTTESINTSSSGISGYRQFEYPFIARAEGTYDLEPVEFTFFDPQRMQYVTLKSKPLTLEITPDARGGGSGDAVVMQGRGMSKEEVKLLGQDIRFIKLGGAQLRSERVPFIFSAAYWILLVGILVLFAMVYIALRRQIRESQNVALVRGKRANKVAVQRFRAAKRYMEEQNRHAFYEEMLRALWGYMSDKFNIPVANLTKENVREELHKRGVSSEDSQRFTAIITQCDEAQYSPVESARMGDVYSEGVNLISRIESVIKR
ncbi:Oxygen tolerance [Alistipes timonensis JC136]|uniref:Oxygen tolerance n=1 Tax=Alistipes timonensis JC136 TaxID=1033731 RepID=A0A1H4EGT1_9BACT|nr:BatD family protein [Alistipes timonensis]SEA84067.1 Oxygen tolerance [Alistipes timonensis JC136]